MVNRFNAARVKEEEEQKGERSFAIYQTTDIQQAYQVLAQVQGNMGQFQSNQNVGQQPTHANHLQPLSPPNASYQTKTYSPQQTPKTPSP